MFKRGEFRKSYAFYFLFVFIIFYSPAFYFVTGGTAYRYFSDDTLHHYMIFSSVIMAFNLIFLYFKESKIFPVIDKKHILNISENLKSWPVKIYFGIIVVSVLLYCCFYLTRFPLISLALKGVLPERPDVTGDIPHFYTLSTFMLFIIPSVFFYYYPVIKNLYIKILLTLFVFILLIISGHKGIIAFFAIFYWVTILNMKVSYRFVVILLGLAAAYAVTKGVDKLNYETIEYLTTSPLRRFFVTQGTCMIFRFHALDIQYVFDSAVPIKNQICNFMSGGLNNGCSSPTFFVGDLMIKYGYYISVLIYTASLYLIILLIKNIDYHFKGNNFIGWSLFCIFFLTGMAEVSSDSIFRIFAIILNVFAVFVLTSFFKKLKIKDDNNRN
jgi:hypothetical protein